MPSGLLHLDTVIALWPFFDGGAWYNLITFVFSLVGVLGGGAGIWIAIVQLVKTKHAAQAAEEAAKAASNQMATVSAVVSLSRLIGLATQLVECIRSKNIGAAALRGLDLRTGTAQARDSRATAMLLPQPDWQLLMTRIGKLHDTLETAARRKPDEELLAQCVKEASAVLETLCGMNGTANDAAGTLHANT